MAAITVEQRAELVALFLTMFGKAPTTLQLARMVTARENGTSLQDIATSASVILESDFALVASMDATAFATYLTNALLASSTPTAAREWATNWVITQVQGNKTKAQVIVEAVQAIRATTNTNYASAQAELSADVTATLTAIDNPTVTPSTFTLTTAPDNITGTGANDIINAYVDAAGATDTLSAADAINGGAGTDTMVITTDGNAAGSLPAATISNVEVFSIREVGGTAGVYDFATVNGETSVINRTSTDDVTFNNIASGATLTILGDGSTTVGATTFKMSSGTAAVTLNLDGGVSGSPNVTRDATGAAAITVNSTGAANTIGTLDLDTGTAVTGLTINATTNLTASLAADYAADSKLTVTGAGLVTLTGATLSTNITVVDGSAQTAGGLAVKPGANTTSFAGGAGNDTVYVDALVYNGTKAVAAGAGTGDLIRLTDSAALTSVTAANLTGFEILRLADDNDGAVDTFDMALLSGLTALQLDADSAGDGYTVNNISAAQAGAVTIRGSQSNVAPTFGVTNATTVGQLDTLGLTISDGSPVTSTITVANLNAAGVETVTVAASDHFTASSLTGLTALTNLTFSASSKNISVTTGALALNVNTTIDASAVTGTVTIDASAATTNGAAIKGSATGANTLKGGVGADVITGGTGIDTVTTAATGADTVNFVSDSSADIFEIAALTGKNTISNFDAATTTTTEDLVNVSHNDLDGAEVAITGAAAQAALGDDTTIVIAQTVGSAGALTTGGTATLVAADFTADTLTNMAAYLSERFTADNADTTAGNQTALIVLNNGTNTYAYVFSDSATQNATIEAGELTLVGIFNGAILNAGDVYQTA